MRSYPQNSPQTAARIIALAMFADGHLSRPEWESLRRTAAFHRFGLAPSQWDRVVHECCQDLLGQGHLSWHRDCRIDDTTLQQLLAEVDDPVLGRWIAWTCGVVVAADGVVTADEWRVLRTLIQRWGLPPRLLPADRG